jgi:hypothetical protein
LVDLAQAHTAYMGVTCVGPGSSVRCGCPLCLRTFSEANRQLPRAASSVKVGDFNEDPIGRAVDYLARHGMTRVPTTGPTTWRYAVTSRGKTFELLKMGGGRDVSRQKLAR